MPELQQGGLKGLGSVEGHRAGAVVMDRDDTARMRGVESDDGADAEAAAGLHHGAEERGVGGLRVEIEDFGLAPSTRGAQQAGREDAAAIDDQEIAGVEQCGKAREVPMRDGPGSTVQVQQARRVAVLERGLRNELGGELEVEVQGLQKSFFCGRSEAARSSPKCR